MSRQSLQHFKCVVVPVSLLIDRNVYCEALATPCDESSRHIVIEAFVQFCQSIAIINTCYTGLVLYSSRPHKLSHALTCLAYKWCKFFPVVSLKFV